MEWMLYVFGIIALLGFFQLVWLIKKYVNYSVKQNLKNEGIPETDKK